MSSTNTGGVHANCTAYMLMHIQPVVGSAVVGVVLGVVVAGGAFVVLSSGGSGNGDGVGRGGVVEAVARTYMQDIKLQDKDETNAVGSQYQCNGHRNREQGARFKTVQNGVNCTFLNVMEM